MTNGIGFDLLEERYNHFLEESERFRDPIEEGLETAAWYTKLQNDIDKTTNNMYKDRLKSLQAEIDMRRENNTLSQYDLDLLEAKYQVL
jgi:chromosome segregation ATPase